MGSKARRQQQAREAREKARAARERGRENERQEILGGLRLEQQAMLASEPPALARRLWAFEWNLRLHVAFMLTIRRLRKEGRRREALGRRVQRQIRAIREAVRKAKLEPGTATTAPGSAIAAATELLAQARREQQALVLHCRRARDEIDRWENVARDELTHGGEKKAKRALIRRDIWARSFRHQVLVAERQEAALTAHEVLLQTLHDELTRDEPIVRH